MIFVHLGNDYSILDLIMQVSKLIELHSYIVVAIKFHLGRLFYEFIQFSVSKAEEQTL